MQRHLSGGVLAALYPELQKPASARRPACGVVFAKHPGRVIGMLDALAAPASEARDASALSTMQCVAVLFAEHVREYGRAALSVLCALVRTGGGRVLRRLPEDGPARLVATCAEQARVLLPANAAGNAEAPPQLCDEACAEDVAALFCALSQLGVRDAALWAALSRHLSDHARELGAASLPVVARALGPGGRGDSCEDFVLLHALSRRGAELIEELDGPSVVALLQAFGRNDVFDEEFLDAASAHLRESTQSLHAGQLGDAMYALGSLQVREAPQLDALCNALRLRVDEISEADLVRFMRGLVKLRHCNEELLAACEPVVRKLKKQCNVVSLTNLISCYSYFETTKEKFFKSLLDAATERVSRLTPMSIQHVLTALCRQQGRMHRDALETPLARVCAQLAAPGVAAQLTMLQAVASLTALARLQHQDHAAAAVLTSVLAGRGASVVWSWAPSAYFYAHGRSHQLPRGSQPFDEARCAEVLGRALESSHCAEVLQSLQRLDLHSALAARLAVLLCGRLVPQLHELKAREVLIVARALGACRLPGPALEEEISTGAAPSTATAAATDRCEPSGAPVSWRERVLDSCFENLRRHEHFLECSWNALLPFKLLCLEVDAETYGSRRLGDVLSPGLLGFVDRLRLLTRAECEANRLRREGAEEDDETAAAAAPAAADAAACSGAAAEPVFVQEFARHRVVVGGHVGDFPVDVLIEPLA